MTNKRTQMIEERIAEAIESTNSILSVLTVNEFIRGRVFALENEIEFLQSLLEVPDDE